MQLVELLIRWEEAELVNVLEMVLSAALPALRSLLLASAYQMKM